MKEERMKILQMIEDGKISVAEANELLAVLGASKEEPELFCCDSEFAEKMKDAWKETCKNTSNFFKDFGKKVGEYAKEVEPRVRNVTKTAIYQTAEMIDELGRSIASVLHSINGDEYCCCGDEEDTCCCCEEGKADDTPKEN